MRGLVGSGRTSALSGVPWAAVVGRSLAASSRPEHLDRRGHLRIGVANEATASEVEARREHVLDAWNALGERHGARRARELSCAIRTEGDWPDGGTRADTGPVIPSSRHRAAAAEEVGSVGSHPAVRRALVEARARAMRKRELATREAPGSGSGRSSDRGGGSSPRPATTSEDEPCDS